MAAEAEDDDYPELRPGGTSKSWLSALANHKNIFNEFLKSLTGELKAGAGQDFDKVDMEILSATKIWGQCGHYLCHDYKITKAGKDKGKSLDEATAIPIFSSLLNMAKRRSATCVLSDEHKVCCLPACARARLLVCLEQRRRPRADRTTRLARHLLAALLAGGPGRGQL
jgi:hypothetical protein